MIPNHQFGHFIKIRAYCSLPCMHSWRIPRCYWKISESYKSCHLEMLEVSASIHAPQERRTFLSNLNLERLQGERKGREREFLLSVLISFQIFILSKAQKLDWTLERLAPTLPLSFPPFFPSSILFFIQFFFFPFKFWKLQFSTNENSVLKISKILKLKEITIFT